ncbi:MAG: aldehyde dehydrogenase family protein, partial [Bacillales bacterium]
TIDVIIEKRMAKEFQVQVELINEDQLPLGYELGVPVVEPQTVTLISSEAIIEQVALVKVFIDVKDLTESIRNRELPVNVYDIQGNDLNVRVEPETVMVSLQVDRPSKLVPLKVRTTGELPDDLELEAIEAPEEIEIFGKRAILNEITEVQTEEIDLSKITKSDTIEVDIDFPEGTTADKETVKVTLKLNKRKIFNDVSIPNQLANGTTYGLAAGILTNDTDRAERVASQIKAGTIWINGYHTPYVEAPWGGFKFSGMGRELGPHGLAHYVEYKHVNARPKFDQLGWYSS